MRKYRATWFFAGFPALLPTWGQNSANKQPPNKGMIKSEKCHFAALDVQDGGKSLVKGGDERITVTYKANLPRDFQVQR